MLVELEAAEKVVALPPHNYSATLLAEAAAVAAHIDRFIGRVLYRDSVVDRDVVLAGCEGPQRFFVGHKIDGRIVRFGSRPFPGFAWGDPKKMPRGFRDVQETTLSNDCVTWHLAMFGGTRTLAGFVPGRRFRVGWVVVGPDTLPVYPHELGLRASQKMLDRMERSLSLLRRAIRKQFAA